VLQVTFAAFSLSEPGGALSSEGAIAVLHDITDQQRLELSRREFIANVSHELRTPLTNIKSYTETVLENPDLPEDNRTGFLKVALGESDRMIRIVKDLLTLSRLDDDRLDLRPRSFDAGELVQRVCEAMQLDAHNSRHALTLEINDPGPVFGDDERLAQVLINVVSNSVKYTPEGGKIHIEAHREGEQVCVSVRDNGIGIPPEDLGRIFERFYRVDKARSREMGGTGLGLAIAQEIIRAHGGDIDIESTLGEGTMVRLLIPVGGPGSAHSNELPLRPGGAPH